MKNWLINGVESAKKIVDAWPDWKRAAIEAEETLALRARPQVVASEPDTTERGAAPTPPTSRS
jgi:hypothetical protein